MNIVTHDHDFGREQAIRASFQPLDVLTDWEAVIADAPNLNPEQLIAELRAGEPYEKNELNELRVWRTNQRIRIAHRYRKGLPQYDGMTCGSCGVRKCVPCAGGYSATGSCLHCREVEYLTPGDSNSHDWPLFTAFDTVSGTWGIAWKREQDRDKTAAIIVNGYTSYFEAHVALKAPNRFAQLYDRATPAGQGVDVDQMVNASELFKLNLPLSPADWEAYLRGEMARATPQDVEPYGYTLKGAAEKFFGKGD